MRALMLLAGSANLPLQVPLQVAPMHEPERTFWGRGRAACGRSHVLARGEDQEAAAVCLEKPAVHAGTGWRDGRHGAGGRLASGRCPVIAALQDEWSKAISIKELHQIVAPAARLVKAGAKPCQSGG